MPLMQLPGYEYPRNALVNFQPINDAIDSNRANALANDRMGLERERVGMERERMGMEKQRFAASQEDQVRKRIGGLALLTMQEPDDAKRAEKWKQVLSLHPEAAKLAPHYSDHRAGPLALMADAGMADDYLKYQLQKQQAALSAQQGQIALAQEARASALAPGALELQRAQIAQANRKDEVSEITAGVMRDALGITPKPGGPVPQSPGIKPMSNPVSGDGDPMLIRTQTAVPDAQPSAPTSAEPQIMVFGKPMPLSKAHVLGNAFLMDQKTRGLGEQIMKDVEKAQLSQSNVTDLQKSLVADVNSIARLTEMRKTYKPEFQTIEGQLAMAGIKFADMSKTLRGNLTPEHRQMLTDYSAYRMNAANNMNQYIKEITGAQMSEAEAKRLIKALPNYETDSPTEFEAKLDESMRLAKLAAARKSYLLKNGLNDVFASIKAGEGNDTITKTQWFLPRFEQFMEQRKSHYDQIYNGDTAAVRKAMRQEFGI
jgi:hypothetical protein